ncbi:hypothetical protein B0I33_101317 [Prauserella shujinwangii]|uniref:Uncharacterized protein n=1 Tax=Prauserella shujinwangii TaxID=1453103 RepID=A0A2T0M342_9PSEU|nr:hypothetical protein [Prauserella shujinwangii]PRX51164.1 hypothetical protein B0I33_101317 [Prauserella shujinwangii]
MVARDPIVSPLQASVHSRLAELTASANGEAGAAHREVALLVEALRAVLADHPLDPRGYCSVCHGRRRGLSFRRRRKLPCRAYLAAQLALGDGAGEPAPAAARHRRRAGSALHYAR